MRSGISREEKRLRRAFERAMCIALAAPVALVAGCDLEPLLVPSSASSTGTGAGTDGGSPDAER